MKLNYNVRVLHDPVNSHFMVEYKRHFYSKWELDSRYTYSSYGYGYNCFSTEKEALKAASNRAKTLISTSIVNIN